MAVVVVADGYGLSFYLFYETEIIIKMLKIRFELNGCSIK